MKQIMQTQKNILMVIAFITAVLLGIMKTQQSFATAISEQQANKVAVTFLRTQTGNSALKAILHFKQVDPDGSVAFYIFNFLAYEGFVIVTGDDNLEPVIAYSTESKFDINIARQGNIISWMNDIQEQTKSILKQNLKADSRISGLWEAYSTGTGLLNPQTASVGPLLTTRWNQSRNGTPSYNSFCPFDTAASNQHCPTGCLATAMAQIMKYWNYPAHGSGSHGYSDNHGYQSASFATATYNWSQMPDVLTSSSTNDVDFLMYHCGVSVDMDYEANASGAYVYHLLYQDAEDGFVDYFNYSSSMYYMSRSLYEQSYGSQGWVQLLKDELDAQRPILYRGDGSGAHAWVCDGYDVNNLFHMNWGWGGSSNGFFSLNSLNPGGNHNYNSDQGALIGIRPDALSSCDSYWNLSGNQNYDYTWQASDYINSSMNILGNTSASYTAQNQIILTPGFYAHLNSTFSAKIKPCITPRIEANTMTESTRSTGESLSVFPNPFSENLTIEFNLPTGDNTTIKLFDIMGKQVKEISNSYLNEGNYNMKVNASDIPPGVYLIFLQGANRRETKKLIKAN